MGETKYTAKDAASAVLVVLVWIALVLLAIPFILLFTFALGIFIGAYIAGLALGAGLSNDLAVLAAGLSAVLCPAASGLLWLVLGARVIYESFSGPREYILNDKEIIAKYGLGREERIPFSEIKLITYHPGYEFSRGKGPVISIFYGTEPSKSANLGFAKLYKEEFVKCLEDLKGRLPKLVEKGLIRQGEYPY
jgi:hypothetical protein